MTLQQLEYFVSAAHNLNFSKTAEMFFVSQSAITQQIRSLEKELKLDLFIRKNNRISLTDSGQVFMREAEQILAKSAILLSGYIPYSVVRKERCGSVISNVWRWEVFQEMYKIFISNIRVSALI